ncbi:MAG TPA: GNAT family N-acetyltransferase [Vicinamibacterales bacterium]|nr:GNAT family N-acetyltransferase [Vicinamibacterales bacterium]
MREVTSPLPAGDLIDSPRLVLRDGTVASVRPTMVGDREAIRRFFHDLSPESRRNRFFTSAEPPDSVIARMSDSTDPHRALTLVVHRLRSDDLRPVALASYIGVTARVAEVAFAVDDSLQGRGVSTALLERLAVHAAREGFQRFQASTFADNHAMLEVFRDSGFEIRSRTSAGVVDLQLTLTMSPQGVRSSEERDRRATAASLAPMLTPSAVAVIGVSRDPAGIGRRVFDALRASGFGGPVHAVNHHAAVIDGVACVNSARALPAGTDLAVIAVPAPAVLGVVDDCAAAGVKSLVVISAGFAEAGADGRSQQQALVERVRNHGMRMVGPNCMGLLNAAAGVRLNASFSPVMPRPGRVALLSQSGALGIAIIELALERQVGLSTFVSVGNKADVSGNDLLQYWERDPDTDVMLLYLESFGNPRRFARLARRIARSKPIVAVKAGRTTAGVRAAGSHTAALAASDVAVDALFRQSGVIRADTIDEMFDVAACLESQPLPGGPRVAIVTNAGGPGILAVDACVAAGLQVVEFTPATRARVQALLHPAAHVDNPVDMIASADPDDYRRTIEAVLTAEEVDALIVIHAPVDRRTAAATHAAIAEGIAAGRRAGAVAKPVLSCLMAEPGMQGPIAVDYHASDDAAVLSHERVPAYRFPENAARALGRIATYAAWRAQPPALFWSFDDLRPDEARDVCRAVLESRGSNAWLTPEETRGVLNAFGLPLLPTVLARSADDAAATASVLGYPVVVKVQARTLLHKSEVGAVQVGLSSERAVRAAYRELQAIASRHLPLDPEQGEGVVIQPMISGGIETLVGVTDDPLFGALVAFGLGGTQVEVHGDVRFRIAPLTDRDADELLHGIRGIRLLQGYRGQPPADLDALREVLLRVARLAEDIPEIAELDLNPVIALPPGNGCRIVDARLRVSTRRAGSLATSHPAGLPPA